MKKRLVIGCVVVIFAVCFLAGCGSTNTSYTSNETEEPEESSDAETEELEESAGDEELEGSAETEEEEKLTLESLGIELINC